MKYLKIRNWDKYQHYKSDKSQRRVVWVKLYTSMLRDTELRRLELSTRLLYDQLLLLAAEYENAIPNDFEEISYATKIPLALVEQGVADLMEGQWISGVERKPPASKMLASRYQADSSTLAQSKRKSKRKSDATPSAFCPVCDLGFLTNQRLSEHLSDVHHIDAA